MRLVPFVFFAFRQMAPVGTGILLLMTMMGCAQRRPDVARIEDNPKRDTIRHHPLEDVVFDRPWPIPVRDTIVLPVHLPERARVEVTILDGSGQVYLHPWQGILSAGGHRLRLSLDGLEAGPWVCTVSGRLQRTNRAFVRAQVIVME